MTVTITPKTLAGTVTPPPSKSQAHRALIAAALAEGESRIGNLGESQDMDATRRCLEALGAEFQETDEGLTVHGIGANAMSPLRPMALPRLDCGESGSTLRFLIPVALAVRGGGIFTGRGRLMERPLEPYFAIFREKGIFYEQKDGALTVQGRLTPGRYALAGNVSSQFFTGLLFALPLLDGPSAIVPTTALESGDYIAMTCQVMERFGVRSAATLSLPPQYHVEGGQVYAPAAVTVEADWSQAGFWYAARALGGAVELDGLDINSAQGDRVIAGHFDQLTRPGDVEIDVSGCPDLVPPLAAMAAARAGRTRLVNAGRLRMKESDRLDSVTQVLSALGADIAQGPDFLDIQGKDRLAGGATVDSFNDHRIAMMTAVAAARCAAPVTLTGAEAVEKSYPDFWREYERLGGELTWNT